MTAAIYNFPSDRVRVRPVPAPVGTAAPIAPLTPRLRAEKACLSAEARASDPDARRIWTNLADWNAVGFRTSRFALGPIPAFERPDAPEALLFDPRERPISLLPWIGAGLALALAIAALPAALMSWGVAVAALYLMAAIAFVFARLT